MSSEECNFSGIAQDMNDSIRTNETSLCVLEEQIDRLTDALVSANADPIEIVGIYEEERAKLQFDMSEKSGLISELEKTIEKLQDQAKSKDDQFVTDLSKVKEKGRAERNSLVEQLRSSQIELMDHYTKIDELENDTERLNFALTTAEERARIQNENLIDQNNALMHALQEEQNKSRDVIEDLERSLQKVSLNSEDAFEKDLNDLPSNMENVSPLFGSSPIKEKPLGSSEELLQKLIDKANKLEYHNKELERIISSLEEEIVKEDRRTKDLESKCFKLRKELEHIQEEEAGRPSKVEVERLIKELESTQTLLAMSEEKVLELEKVLYTTLNKHEALVGELINTISSQDKQIEELKKKNFYPKLMDDLKKENSRLKDEVNKLNKLLKQTPTKKINQLKDKFEQKEVDKSFDKTVESEEKRKIVENLQIKHREDINHLKSKLVILEKKLNQSLDENAQLNLELSEAIDQLDENSFNYETVIHDLQKKLNDSKIVNEDSNLDESVLDIKQHLEKEIERNKNLSILLAEYEKGEKDDLPPPPPSIIFELPLNQSSPISIKPVKSSPPPVATKPNSIKLLADKLADVKKENEENEKSLATITTEKTFLIGEKSVLEKKISAQEGEIQSLRQQVKRGVSVCVTPIPYKEVDQLEKELEDSLLDKEHLEETIDIISEEHDAQIKDLNDEIECLKKELELAGGMPADDSLIEQLALEREKRCNLTARIEELEFELSEVGECRDEDSLKNLKDNLDEAEKMCEELMSPRSTSEDTSPTINDVKKMMKQKDGKIKELEGKTKDMAVEMEHLTKELADISIEISDADHQYSKKIDHLQDVIESNKDEYDREIQDLQDEIEILAEQIEEEQHSGRVAHLEDENVKLIEECKTLTDKLASNILSKIAPNDERIDIIEEMKGQFEKCHARLRSEIDHKAKKIEDLQSELKRIHSNSARKIATLRENLKIKEEQAELKVQEEILTSDSLKKELDQLKKINMRYEENLSDKSHEFSEVVTKLLNLENLIELQKDNLLAKDEQIQAINKQIDHLKEELDIAQHQQTLLKQESIAVEELEVSLNEISEHDKLLQENVTHLEKEVIKERLVSDKLCSEQNDTVKELNLLKKALKDSTTQVEILKEDVKIQLETIEDLEEDKHHRDSDLMKKIERLETQNEELSEQENILCNQVNELFDEKNKLEEELAQLRDEERDKEEFLAAEEFDYALKKRDGMIEELERSLAEKEGAIEKKTNDINRLLNEQDKMKHDLVAKNIELESQYELLMEKFCDIDGEKDGLLEEIDNNFKAHTQTLSQLDSELSSLKAELAKKDDLILEKDEEVNEMNAKNLANSQSFFETRKRMEHTIMLLKTKLMDIEGGDAIRRTSSANSVWLEDTSSLNHIIGEKDKEILNLRESIKNNEKSTKESCLDIEFGRQDSERSIPPPTEMEIAGDYLPNDEFVIESYKSNIQKLLQIMDKKDEEYNKLAAKFKTELECQVHDSNIYNTHIEKLQNMATLFQKETDQLLTDNKNIIDKSSKRILDVNETLTGLTNELQLESEKTTEVLGELDILKEEIENIQKEFSSSHQPDTNLQKVLTKILSIEDNMEMAVEEHQCSLDQYQLLLQTYQQEILMIDEEINSIGNKNIQTEHSNVLEELLMERMNVLTERLESTKNDVTATQFRGSQVSEKENDLAIEQAKYKCSRYENEVEIMRRMMKNQEGEHSKLQAAMSELSVELLSLKDLLSLERKMTPSQFSSEKMRQQLSQQESRKGRDKGSQYNPSRTLRKDLSQDVIEDGVNICEIYGLELVTHDLRAKLRSKTNECEELMIENDTMSSTLRHIQSEFGQMLSARTVELDVLNDTMSSERNLLEEKLERLSEKMETKESNTETLKSSLSFEQGRVQQLKEDLETTYDTSFQHIKEYEGRVSTITERLNAQQQAVKAKLMDTQNELDDLRRSLREHKILLGEKESTIEVMKIKHEKEIKNKEADIEKVKDEAMKYVEEAEEIKKSFNNTHGSYDARITQYSDIMSKFRNEISEEKEAFQNSLKKLNYLVEDRTHKIREYEQIVHDLQSTLSATQRELENSEALNEILIQDKDSLKVTLLAQRTTKEGDKQRENEVNLLKNKANKASQQALQLKVTLDDTKRRYEAELSHKADELLKTRMKLEKCEEDERATAEENKAIQDEVKALKLEIENAGSDNQVKDLEQKLAGSQSEVEDASYRLQRYQREIEALKEVLASYQSPADNDIAQKISEYETTVADYEVQVTMLKKNISDLHTQLHNTYDERQRVIEKAQAQIAVYQRRLEQMNSRVEEAQQTSKRDTTSLVEAQRAHTVEVSSLERRIAGMHQKSGKVDRQLASDKISVLDNSASKDIQQRFELAVKRADHLQEQVDTMRSSNKRIQKTVEDLWTENTHLLKELSNVKELHERSGSKRRGGGETKSIKSSLTDNIKTADI